MTKEECALHQQVLHTEICKVSDGVRELKGEMKSIEETLEEVKDAVLILKVQQEERQRNAKTYLKFLLPALLLLGSLLAGMGGGHLTQMEARSIISQAIEEALNGGK